MKSMVFLVIFAVLFSDIFVSAADLPFLSFVKKTNTPLSCPEGTSDCGGVACCTPGKCCHLNIWNYYYCCS